MTANKSRLCVYTPPIQITFICLEIKIKRDVLPPPQRPTSKVYPTRKMPRVLFLLRYPFPLNKIFSSTLTIRIPFLSHVPVFLSLDRREKNSPFLSSHSFSGNEPCAASVLSVAIGLKERQRKIVNKSILQRIARRRYWNGALLYGGNSLSLVCVCLPVVLVFLLKSLPTLRWDKK